MDDWPSLRWEKQSCLNDSLDQVHNDLVCTGQVLCRLELVIVKNFGKAHDATASSSRAGQKATDSRQVHLQQDGQSSHLLLYSVPWGPEPTCLHSIWNKAYAGTENSLKTWHSRLKSKEVILHKNTAPSFCLFLREQRFRAKWYKAPTTVLMENCEQTVTEWPYQYILHLLGSLSEYFHNSLFMLSKSRVLE